MLSKGYFWRFAGASAAVIGVGMNLLSSINEPDTKPPAAEPAGERPYAKVLREYKPNPLFLYVEDVVGTPANVVAYPEFCEQHKDSCQVSPDMLMVKYEPWVDELLNKVNIETNERYIYKLDKDQYGVEDKFALPDIWADCEDYALAKREALLPHIPSAAMMIAFVLTKDGKGHAVLIVRTDKGDKVLDNGYDHVVNLSDTSYDYKYVTDPLDNKQWREVVYNNPPAQKQARPVMAAAEKKGRPVRQDITQKINAAFEQGSAQPNRQDLLVEQVRLASPFILDLK